MKKKLRKKMQRVTGSLYDGIFKLWRAVTATGQRKVVQRIHHLEQTKYMAETIIIIYIYIEEE